MKNVKDIKYIEGGIKKEMLKKRIDEMVKKIVEEKVKKDIIVDNLVWDYCN